MKMTVIGGGNIGTLIAAEMANQGHAVTVYTSRPERWKRKISDFAPANQLLMPGNLPTDNMDYLSGAAFWQLIGTTFSLRKPWTENRHYTWKWRCGICISKIT